MKPEQIKVGRFYRFGASSSVMMMIGEWPASETESRRLEYVTIHLGREAVPETRTQTAEQIAAWAGCEMEPTFKPIELPPEPDPGQIDHAASDFMTGILGG